MQAILHYALACCVFYLLFHSKKIDSEIPSKDSKHHVLLNNDKSLSESISHVFFFILSKHILMLPLIMQNTVMIKVEKFHLTGPTEAKDFPYACYVRFTKKSLNFGLIDSNPNFDIYCPSHYSHYYANLRKKIIP